ncbi:MAG: YdcH family protein [Gammaproteobacteria bacterium]|nr:YdcH family protein [Gammaproteobacteria bacterium]
MQNEESLYKQLYEMRSEHRDLDDAIKRLEEGPFVDQLQLRRLKKRKLQLKEYIDRLESKLIPDIDA